MPPAPDPTNLTDDVIIVAGGWNATYARVVMVAVDHDEAITLVDGNGDGVELEQEFWTRESTGWRAGSSVGYGSLTRLPTSIWDAGHAVCAFGSISPGETVHIRYEGVIHECVGNQYGIWAFIRKVEHMNVKHPLPELLN